MFFLSTAKLSCLWMCHDLSMACENGCLEWILKVLYFIIQMGVWLKLKNATMD